MTGVCETNVNSSALLDNYLHTLINRFFKILPMKESSEQTLNVYMKSLQMELIGCRGVVSVFSEDSTYLSLIAILQYFIDTPDCSVEDTRREVFGAISLCNLLIDKYT